VHLVWDSVLYKSLPCTVSFCYVQGMSCVAHFWHIQLVSPPAFVQLILRNTDQRVATSGPPPRRPFDFLSVQLSTSCRKAAASTLTVSCYAPFSTVSMPTFALSIAVSPGKKHSSRRFVTCYSLNIYFDIHFFLEACSRSQVAALPCLFSGRVVVPNFRRSPGAPLFPNARPLPGF